MISKGEKYIVDQGLYVAEPLCLMMLFNSGEQSVLRAIRHCANVGETFVSLSSLALMTNLSENSVKKARDSLLEGGFIEQGATCKDGTNYTVVYKRLNDCIHTLNGIKDPKVRLATAISIRKNTNKQ